MGVILRFRVDDVTVMADIKRMFHQVFVAPQVRGAFVICGGQMVIYEQSQRPTRCLSTSLEPSLHRAVFKDFYVDNLLKSFASEEHVKDIRKFQDLLARGGFQLSKWISNRRFVSISSWRKSSAH